MRSDLHRIFEDVLNKYLPVNAVLYDIGCGQKPFAEFLKGKVKSHVELDLADGFYQPDQVDLIGTAYAVPAPDGCADAVISSQVIEHLETPLVAIAETHRLLKRGVFPVISFLYPQHAEPRDFLRYTEFYLEQEIASNKFEVLAFERIGGFWYLIGMYFNLYLQQMDRGILKKMYVVKVLVFILNVLFRGLHELEGLAFKLAKKDIKGFALWRICLLVFLRKEGIIL